MPSRARSRHAPKKLLESTKASRTYYEYNRYEMSIDEPHDDPAFDRIEQLLRASGPPPEPSAALRARLLAIPRGEATPVPAARRSWKRIWSSLPAWRVASGALALAALVLAVVAVSGGSDTGVSGQRIVLAASSEYRATGEAVSLVSDGTRRIRIRIDGLPQVKGSQVYELWLAKDRAHRVSIGIFRPDVNGSIDTTVAVPNLGRNWRGIWLTHEQGTGKPGWSHDWVVAGRLA
jgi:anti-sigma-K factor RskA